MSVVSQIDSAGTLLVIRNAGLSPYAARGLTQTLAPIDQAADLRRTINATLIDFSNPSFRKLKSSITCTDRRPPPILWPGEAVTIECACYLGYCTGSTGFTGAYSQLYTAVTGSHLQDGDWIFYRPVLDMIFVGWNHSTPEWDADVSWSMDFEMV